MLSWLLSLILTLINFIIMFVLNLILSVFPNFGLARLLQTITAFFGILGKGLNLLYLLVGPNVFIFGDIIIILFTLKHIALPIINFIRKKAIR